MVRRRRARNLSSNLLLIFPAQSCRVEGWREFNKASGLLDANTACIPAGVVSLLLLVRTVARKVKARGSTAECSRRRSHLLADILCVKASVHCVFSSGVQVKASRSTFWGASVSLWTSVMGCLFSVMCGINQAPPATDCHVSAHSKLALKAKLLSQFEDPRNVSDTENEFDSALIGFQCGVKPPYSWRDRCQ